MTALNVLDLFSGIGGFSLGLERTGGFRTVAFCEIEEYPRRVLAKHWPGVPCYDDVRTLTADRLRTDGVVVDVICGGFPCQDISTAGHGAGLEGERSGLWFEYARLIGELRPRYVIVENVAALLVRGLDRVLGSLAALGYDAEWHCIPAAAVGAPHRRDRVWIIAYPARELPYRGRAVAEQGGRVEPANGCHDVADAASDGRREGCGFGDGKHGAAGGVGNGELAGSCARGSTHVPQPDSSRLAFWQSERGDACPQLGPSVGGDRRQPESGMGRSADGLPPLMDGSCLEAGPWGAGWEDGVPRVANGVPKRVDRLRCLGNAVVPQIPELIGRAILAAHEARAA